MAAGTEKLRREKRGEPNAALMIQKGKESDGRSTFKVYRSFFVWTVITANITMVFNYHAFGFDSRSRFVDRGYRTKTSVDNLEQRRIVVTMKTIPSRVKHIAPTLDSLLFNQSMSFDKFYVTLMPHRDWKVKNNPHLLNNNRKNEDVTLPRFLRSHVDEGRITLLRPEYDYGPVDKMLHALEKERKHTNCTIIYLDDDVIYHPSLIENLVLKSWVYPDAAIGFSGTKLRSNFRQIKHRNLKDDRHPNLFYPLSGTKTFQHDVRVDILQGFAGVVIRPRFFDYPEFLKFVQDATQQSSGLVWKADDFIIGAYLEYRNVPRWIVSGGTNPVINKVPSETQPLHKMMHLQTLEAVFYLQQTLKIWKNLTFVDILSQPSEIVNLINCEASGNRLFCGKDPQLANYTGAALMREATRRIDKALSITP